jgi:hypothetical protein
VAPAKSHAHVNFPSGITYDEASKDKVVLRCTVKENMLQPASIVHGGGELVVVESLRNRPPLRLWVPNAFSPSLPALQPTLSRIIGLHSQSMSCSPKAQHRWERCIIQTARLNG